MSNSSISSEIDSHSESGEDEIVYNIENTETDLQLSILLSNLNIEKNNLLEKPFVNITQIENLNMAPPTVLDIKNLSVIPNFNGNPNTLHRFISACESILTEYYDKTNTNSFQNVLLTNSILNKLEGRAEEVIVINGVEKWDDIKKTLLANFSDQRDETCLNQDLVNLRQKPNETPHQFYEKVIHLLTTICNYIKLNYKDNEVELKRSFFTKQALRTFLAGLREPLGPIIRAMRPDSLTTAIQYITEENNIKYLQTSSSSLHTKQLNVGNQMPRYTPRLNQYPMSNFNRNSFPRGNLQRNTNHSPQRFPTHFQASKPPTNVWKPNPNFKRSEKPTPMSVSTRTINSQPRQTYNHFQNRGYQPNVIAEELFCTEHYQEENEEDSSCNNYSFDLEENVPNYNTDNMPENFYQDLEEIEET